MKYKKNKQFGFTLVELLVVLSIFGIMSLYAVPFFQEIISTKDLSTAKNTLVTSLNKAKRIASAENTYVNVELDGHAIQLTSQASGQSETRRIPGSILFSDKQSLIFGANGVITSEDGNTIESDTQIHLQHASNTSLEETISISTTGLVATLE
jgi:prepilin-type N-terminal cleavage/methylation domain-containing protein